MRNIFRRKKQRRTAARGIRSFEASDTSRLLSGWRIDGGFTASEITSYLASLRGRSREMMKDSPHYKRWLQLVAANVVGGDGFSLKSLVNDGPATGFHPDDAAIDMIEYHWKRFCTYRNRKTKQTWFECTGRKNANEVDRLNAKTWAKDGEYFIYIIKTNANPYGITFKVIRPDWCDHTYNVKNTGSGTFVNCGVEMEMGTRRPVAYWFSATPTDAYPMQTVQGKTLCRIPKEEIIHGFTQEDEDQPRGIPWAHASLKTLKMVDSYNEAELTAARDEACSVRTYYAEKGDEEEFQDLTTDANKDAASALMAEKEPGQGEILPAGWKAEINTPQHPNKEVTAFKSSMLKDVASGLGVEYSNFANDWAGVSFSSVRVGTIAERDQWIMLQNDMISQSKSPMFLAWLDSFLLSPISGEMPESKYDKFAEHKIRGRRWMWVDPMKDVNASVISVENNWKTNTEVAAEMGGDYANNVEIAKREQVLVAGDSEDAVPALNGAQITASVEILQQYAMGSIDAEPAVALLTAAGVPSDAATNMINKQSVNKGSADEA